MAAIGVAWTVAAAGSAMGAPLRPAGIAARGPILALMTEENLPPEALSPGATPAPSASGLSTSIAPAQTQTPAAEPTPGAEPTGVEQTMPGEMTPEPSPTDVPPPLDLSNVPTSARISNASLDPLIKQTTDPSLVASLRLTEEARRQIIAGHPNQAIRTLGHAVSIDATNPYAYFYLGRAWLLKGDYQQALTFLVRAEIGLGSNPPWLGETLSFEGACYEELRQDQQAADAYRRALIAAPGNLMARAGYGRLADQVTPTPNPEETPSEDDLSPPAGAPLENAPEQPVPLPPPTP